MGYLRSNPAALEFAYPHTTYTLGHNVFILKAYVRITEPGGWSYVSGEQSHSTGPSLCLAALRLGLAKVILGGAVSDRSLLIEHDT